jgi:Uma2 family endonuclease
MPSPAARIARQILARLRIYLSRHPHGHLVVPPQRFLLAEDLWVTPDVGYISTDTLPTLPPDAVIPHHPDLAIHIRAATDDLLELRQLCMTYMDHDTPVVWLVDVPARSMELFANQPSGGTIMATAGPGATVNGGTLLPGFQLRVAEIFG